ncbi:DUF2484 family protein [Shimia haliotis]|uniref:DUF2484 family protein n=1 Tax=Shimia haliotis TaxID=1280847 RepID=A0A1I4A7P2_9RHOB|nr:DUF2484 family protein [Shimia haliotis]SFK51839.1 Protein of unknown function [Shimia haliotis]
MTISLGLACVWLVAANFRAMFPSKDHLWSFAYVMIALGLPILVGVYIENGIWAAAIVLVMGGWIMRWPVYYAWLWLKKRVS